MTAPDSPQEQAARTAEYLTRLESGLEALASSWDDAAGRHRHGGPAEGAAADTLAICARQLREAIAHGGQG